MRILYSHKCYKHFSSIIIMIVGIINVLSTAFQSKHFSGLRGPSSAWVTPVMPGLVDCALALIQSVQLGLQLQL